MEINQISILHETIYLLKYLWKLSFLHSCIFHNKYAYTMRGEKKRKFSSAKAKKLGQAYHFCRSGTICIIYHYNHCYYYRRALKIYSVPDKDYPRAQSSRLAKESNGSLLWFVEQGFLALASLKTSVFKIHVLSHRVLNLGRWSTKCNMYFCCCLALFMLHAMERWQKEMVCFVVTTFLFRNHRIRTAVIKETIMYQKKKSQIPQILRHCLTLSSLLPEALMDECTWTIASSVS